MDDLILLLLERYGAWSVIAAILLILIAESILDAIKDFVVDWIKERRIK